ncbi:MAG: PAS domain S-box protein, partial [Thermodesulfobacteriota bacterium]|nr:PAS domain S-box protein [Thermodesulfobacteriota bacterium]
MKQPKHEMPEKYQDLYDNAPIAYFSVGTDGLIHFCNHRAEELVGYAVEELVGQSVVELCADTPQGKKAAAELLKNFRAGETVTDEVLEIQKADGMPVWISLTVNAVKDKHRHIVESRAVVVDITKKKIIEKQISEHCSQLESLVEECTRKLAESEERYSTIMEQGKDGVVIVKDERIVFANKKIAEVSGYTIDEIKESSLEKLIAPESLEIALPRMRQRLAGKAVVPTYEIEFIHKDGKVIPAEINSKRIAYEGGYADLVIVRDISRFKLVQEELRKEKTMAENYLNVAAVIILVLNTEGNVTLINKRGCNILGYDEAEIIGKNWFDHFLPQENINEVKSVFTMLMEGEIELGEYYENPVKTRTGEERFIAWNNVPLRDEKGNSIGTLSSGLDITERKRAEYERLQLEAQLQKAQKMEAIGTLAGGIAHDFNNILFPILGYTELTINAIPDNNIARKNLNEILKAAKRASKLVNQILAFSRQHDQDPKPQEVQIVV